MYWTRRAGTPIQGNERGNPGMLSEGKHLNETPGIPDRCSF